MLAAELVAPKGSGQQRSERQRKTIFAGISVVLCVLAVIALASINGGSRSELQWDSISSSTGQAAAIRGSVSTADAEATAIMETNGLHYDEDMGVPYTRDGVETSGSFDQTQVLRLCMFLIFFC